MKRLRAKIATAKDDVLRWFDRRVARVHEEEPALEVIVAGPRWGYTGAPIVFVHGAFGGAWMWDQHFLGYFAKAGRRVHAISLRGHGRSEGYDKLNTTALSDYIADVRRVLAKIDAPPVLVGHSLGGLIVQRLINHSEMRGVILMASAPPEGIFLIGNNLVRPDPVAMLDVFHRPGRVRSQTELWRKLLFSDTLAATRVAAYASRMGSESPCALSEAQIPGMIVSARSAKIPALVMAAADDRIVEYAMSRRTAHYHGATFRKIERTGHAMMLDTNWREAAKTALEWLKENEI